MAQAQWIDNKTGAVYSWPINYESEDPIRTMGRRLTRGGKARRVRLLSHPTHPGPARRLLHGTFLDRAGAQYAEFLAVFKNCDDRTFNFVDANGDTFEVLVIQFDARRTMAAGRDDGSYIKYQLEIEIVRALSGPLVGHVG